MTNYRTVTEKDRRADARPPAERWHTALTFTAPNKVLIRGYPLDEMMGRLSFADAVYLLLMGELPTPAIGRMLNAVLISSIDHGVTPPSTMVAAASSIEQPPRTRVSPSSRNRMHDSMSPP